MRFEEPCEDRMDLLQAVLHGDADADELTEMEYLWLQNWMMDLIIEHRAQTNPLVFDAVEDAMMN